MTAKQAKKLKLEFRNPVKNGDKEFYLEIRDAYEDNYYYLCADDILRVFSPTNRKKIFYQTSKDAENALKKYNTPVISLYSAYNLKDTS